MKKISLLVMMLVVLLSVFAIEVSAEYYINEGFEEDLSGLTQSTGGEWADGALQVYTIGATAADCRISAASSPIPKNVTVCFDYKLGGETTSTARPAINVYTGFCRAWLSPELGGMRVVSTGYVTDYHANMAANADQWYSVMLQFKTSGDTVVFDMYRKEQGSSQPYQKYVSAAPVWTNDDPARFQIDGSCDASVDNIKIYAGSFATGTGFEFDGTPIESLSDIGNGTLRATTMLVSNKIVLGSGDKLVPTNVTPVLVFYNKNGRLISCAFVQGSELVFGENEVEITVDTSSFYNKLDGGYGALYFIDDFENLQLLADKVEL